MDIIIWSLEKQTHREVIQCIGIYGEVIQHDPQFDTVDVRLDESVIVKTHYDSVTLDLGGKLAIIDKDEFECIKIY